MTHQLTHFIKSSTLVHAATAVALLLGSMSSQAMLPMPEPALDNQLGVNNVAMLQPANAPFNTGYNTASTTNNAARTLSAAPAAQQAQGGIQSRTMAALVRTDTTGNVTLVPVDANTRLASGDVIEYQTFITNGTPDRIESAIVTTSIPAQVSLSGNVTPSTASASIDGTNFSRMPLRTRVNGQLQDIPLSYYKHLRWTVEDLNQNATAVLKYRTTYR